MVKSRLTVLSAVAASLTAFSATAAFGGDMPDPTGEPADMSKPVQVYILMGQSNMVGAGHVHGNKDGALEYAVKEKGKYPYLMKDGEWSKRKDVRYTFNMGSGTGKGSIKNNAWMSIEGNGRIGPEFGIGYHLGDATDAPVLILKSCIGNRALGWDLLPPGSKQYEFERNGKTMVHAGYKGSPKWYEKGTEPKPINWYAGMQYDGDVRRAKDVLKNLDKYYPGAKDYEVEGFLWWQGDRDRRVTIHAKRYEHNLVNLIEALRKEFDAPEAEFVTATLGQTEKGAGGNEGMILEAMFNISDWDKYSQFKGDTATVYTHPLSQGGSSGGHYGGNAETYMNVGEAMGKAMVELEKKD
jgi:hypothetical protein